ncbi:hypothetical protein NIES4071_03830 [Calothrix sp. NIES-4071]|nr:hypothetical protein NIES4071_03830 [Calothrix sp. NIES-4071]BAZ54729.1 hypothetical protein NIES4105_03820 [Calothrix sp. NIES-4105]
MYRIFFAYVLHAGKYVQVKGKKALTTGKFKAMNRIKVAYIGILLLGLGFYAPKPVEARNRVESPLSYTIVRMWICKQLNNA